MGAGESCEVKSMAPVYPKERVPGRTNFVLEARGHVMTAPPDSQVQSLSYSTAPKLLYSA